jgi:hypothetical protein
MHEIVTEIDLHATARRVWAVLTDFPSYRAWNPTIQSIDGTLAQGVRLRLNLRPEALRLPSRGPVRALKTFVFRTWCALNGMSIPVRVTKLLPERELRWTGTLLVPNMFEGEHFFRITERSGGRVHFMQGERYAGLLEPAFREAMEAINRVGMNAVNHALKLHVEAHR